MLRRRGRYNRFSMRATTSSFLFFSPDYPYKLSPSLRNLISALARLYAISPASLRNLYSRRVVSFPPASPALFNPFPVSLSLENSRRSFLGDVEDVARERYSRVVAWIFYRLAAQNEIGSPRVLWVRLKGELPGSVRADGGGGNGRI